VVVVPDRWQACGHGEDVVEFLQQYVHQIDPHHRVGRGHHAPLGNALLDNSMVVMPAAHAAAIKIPQDQS
jgi:hypothetical protein